MGYKIIYKKRFVKELPNFLSYLELEWSKKVADEFQDKVNNAIALLRRHLNIGIRSKKIPGASGMLITQHNRMYYRVGKNTISIIILADNRMKNYST